TSRSAPRMATRRPRYVKNRLAIMRGALQSNNVEPRTGVGRQLAAKISFYSSPAERKVKKNPCARDCGSSRRSLAGAGLLLHETGVAEMLLDFSGAGFERCSDREMVDCLLPVFEAHLFET